MKKVLMGFVYGLQVATKNVKPGLMRVMTTIPPAITLLLVLGFAPITAGAATSFLFASSGSLGASATFDDAVGGPGTLTITLANTGTGDLTGPSQLLSALFFSVAGNPTLTPMTALLNGSSKLFVSPTGADVTPVDKNVGGEWFYRAGLSGAPLGANQGFSSVGFSSAFFRDLGSDSDFNGPNLGGPPEVDGPQFGITTLGDNMTTWGGRDTELIRNSVKFTFSSFTGSVGDISNVSFQYGSGLDEPNLPAIPEPEIYAMLAAGLGLMGFVARRRKQQLAAAG